MLGAEGRGNLTILRGEDAGRLELIASLYCIITCYSGLREAMMKGLNGISIKRDSRPWYVHSSMLLLANRLSDPSSHVCSAPTPSRPSYSASTSYDSRTSQLSNSPL